MKHTCNSVLLTLLYSGFRLRHEMGIQRRSACLPAPDGADPLPQCQGLQALQSLEYAIELSPSSRYRRVHTSPTARSVSTRLHNVPSLLHGGT